MAPVDISERSSRGSLPENKKWSEEQGGGHVDSRNMPYCQLGMFPALVSVLYVHSNHLT